MSLIKKPPKGQITIEFLIIVIMLVTVFAILAPIAWHRQVEVLVERERIAATKVAMALEQEIDLATRFGDGYYRNFTLPKKLLRSPYTISMLPEDRLFFLSWDNEIMTKQLMTSRICNSSVYNPSEFAGWSGFRYTKALWHFDEGSGQWANDSACIYRTDGMLGDSSAVDAVDPTWTVGVHGRALDFDESAEYVTIPVADGDVLDIAGSLAVEAWIKPRSVDGNRSIIDRIYNYALWIREGRIVFSVGSTPDVIEIQSVATVQANDWTHVAGVYDHAASQLSIYINGRLDNNKYASFDNWVPNNYPILIGNGNVAGSMASQFFGVIDEVRISTPEPLTFQLQKNLRIQNEANYIIISEV